MSVVLEPFGPASFILACFCLLLLALARYIDTETDRQTDSQTDWKAGRQADRQTDRQTDRQIDR